MQQADRTFAAAQRTERSNRLMLWAVGLAYVSLGTILGFVQGGVAPVLRTQGMDLSAMRWVYALYLPFGIAFLWAPMLDTWRWPWMGRRTGWIIPMQALSVCAIAAMACIAPQAGGWGALLALGLIATCAAATMDVALDALTVEMLPGHHRAYAAAAKMGGVSLGSVIGGGVLVALYPRWGWTGTMAILALIMALSALPVLPLIGRDRVRSTHAPRQRARLRQTLRKPGMGRRFLRLTWLVCTLLALFSFNRLLLVDMGVPLERIGSVLGTVAPLANATACGLVPLLLRRVSVHRAARLMAVVCLASAGIVWLGIAQHSVSAAIVGSILVTAGAAALYVVLGGLMLEWASGDQAATDYALLYGLGRLIGTAALMTLPGVIQRVGWEVFQGLLVLMFAWAVFLFLRLLSGSGTGPSSPTMMAP